MDLKKKVSKSFKELRTDAETFKQSMNEWIVFLDHSHRDTKNHVRELERRLRILEHKIERERFLLR